MSNLPFHVLLYRYLFFGWLFKDVSTGGNVFERAALHRHNREQARWLPVYLMRWLWLGLACYAIGQLMELVLEAPLLFNVFYTLSAASVPFAVAIATTWVALRHQRVA